MRRWRAQCCGFFLFGRLRDHMPLFISRFPLPARLQASRKLEAWEYMRLGVDDNGVEW